MDPILEVHEVVAGYSQSDIVLNGISFNIEKGEKLCIIGPNGAGKTTLLRVLFGQPPAILLKGQVPSLIGLDKALVAFQRGEAKFTINDKK